MSFSFSVRWLIEAPQVTARPGALGGADDVERGGAGDLRGVVAPAGEAGEPDVALDHGDLGLARDAGEPEPRRHLALVHDAVADEVGVGGMLHDQRIEVAAIGQRPAHDRGVHHACGARR